MSSSQMPLHLSSPHLCPLFQMFKLPGAGVLPRQVLSSMEMHKAAKLSCSTLGEVGQSTAESSSTDQSSVNRMHATKSQASSLPSSKTEGEKRLFRASITRTRRGADEPCDSHSIATMPSAHSLEYLNHQYRGALTLDTFKQ